MKYLALLSFLLVALVVWQVLRTQHFIKIGERIRDNTVSYEQHPANPTMRVLTLGDSSAVGVGAGRPEFSVAGRFGEDYPNADVINIAVSGAKTGEVLAQLDTVKDQEFDLVLVHAGGNDIVRFTSFDEVETQLGELLGVLKPMSKKIVLIHGGSVGTSRLFPAGMRWLFGKRTVMLRERYLSIAAADDQIVYADIYRPLQDDLFGKEPSKYYSADFFHPSDDGYAIWYAGVTEALGE